MLEDKQIIIDVCPYQGECSVSGCKRNDDGCFVRQLFEERYRAENQIVELNKTIKAKEQDCEFSNLRIIQLQETLSQYETDLSTKDCIVETCKAQYKELEAENERLKKEIRLYACIDKWGTEQCHCACRCLSNEFCDAAEKKMKNVKQTLAEIKEIMKKHCRKCKKHKFYHFQLCCTCKYTDILQKISEVVDG